MAGFVNNVLFTPTLGGTTDWVVSAAVGGFNTPAGAGAVDGMTYKYRAESADLSQWEVGEGIYTSGTTTLTRASVSLNSLGTTAKINFSTVPQVGIVTLAQDLLGVDQSNSWSTTQQAMARLTNLNAGIADLWERVGDEPSLDLLADDIAAMFTTTRASTGTYCGIDGLMKTAAANVPRVTYNPVTHQMRGFLVEPSSTNLCLGSETFDNASFWGKTRVTVTANAIAAPTGALTMDKIVEDTSTGAHYVASAAMTIASGARVTFSAFYKAGGRTRGKHRISGTGGAMETLFDLSTGTVGSNIANGPFSGVTSGIEDWGGGLYRVWVSGVTTGITSINALAILVSTGSTDTYTGDGVSGVYAWGAQIESFAGSTYPTSYIPTAGTIASRSGETPFLFTDATWFNGVEGALCVGVTLPGLSGGASVDGIGFDGGGTINSIYMRFGTVIAGTDLVVYIGGVAQVDTGSFAITPLVRVAHAYAYANNDFAYVKDGAAPATAASGSLPLITRFQISTAAGNSFIIDRLTYWPKRLTNAQLQLLTAVA